eukprot:m.136247 g.136247  ORF g.136247 m.136247 type:complete len:394 (-) comp14727_c0_seq2:915-2096(-)
MFVHKSRSGNIWILMLLAKANLIASEVKMHLSSGNEQDTRHEHINEDGSAEYTITYDPNQPDFDLDELVFGKKAKTRPEMIMFKLSSNLVTLPEDGSFKLKIRLYLKSEIGVSDYREDAEAGETFIPSQMLFTGPDSAPLNVFIIPSEHLIEGDGKAGLYEIEVELAQWTTSNGIYILDYIILCDLDGNQKYYDNNAIYGLANGQPVNFQVTGGKTDADPPLLLDLILPNAINGSAFVYILLHESISGLGPLASPVLNMGSHLVVSSRLSPDVQKVYVHFDENNLLAPDEIDSDISPFFLKVELRNWNDALVYKVNVSLPDFAWSGLWMVDTVVLVDKAANKLQLETSDLQDWGIASDFVVHNANLTYLGDHIYHYTEFRYDGIYEEVEEEDE